MHSIQEQECTDKAGGWETYFITNSHYYMQKKLCITNTECSPPQWTEQKMGRVWHWPAARAQLYTSLRHHSMRFKITVINNHLISITRTNHLTRLHTTFIYKNTKTRFIVKLLMWGEEYSAVPHHGAPEAQRPQHSVLLPCTGVITGVCVWGIITQFNFTPEHTSCEAIWRANSLTS